MKELEDIAVSKIPTTLEVLIRARSLLDKPEAWTQGVFGQNKYGHRIKAENDDAVCWCLKGAIARAVHELTKDTPLAVESYIKDVLKDNVQRAIELELGEDIIVFNDHPGTTHRAVLRRLNNAIARQKMHVTVR